MRKHIKYQEWNDGSIVPIQTCIIRSCVITFVLFLRSSHSSLHLDMTLTADAQWRYGLIPVCCYLFMYSFCRQNIMLMSESEGGRLGVRNSYFLGATISHRHYFICIIFFNSSPQRDALRQSSLFPFYEWAMIKLRLTGNSKQVSNGSQGHFECNVH